MYRLKPEAEYHKGTYITTDSNAAYGLSLSLQPPTDTSPSTAEQEDNKIQETVYEAV